jgi:hypothetical protein
MQKEQKRKKKPKPKHDFSYCSAILNYKNKKG